MKGRLILAAAALACLFEPAPARADLATLSSLQWLVASHDCVIMGRVDKLKTVPRGNGARWSTGTPAHGQLKCPVGRYYNARPRAGAPGPGATAILFVRKVMIPSSCGPDPRTGKTHYSQGHEVAFWLDGGRGWALPGRDFKMIRGIPALIAAIRTASREPATLRSLALPVPAGSELRRGRGKLGSVSLVVPRDRKTEGYLLALIGSQQPADRVLGANLIVHYESVPNIRLLLALRDDKATVQSRGRAIPWVREAAERTLRRWHVPLPPRSRSPK